MMKPKTVVAAEAAQTQEVKDAEDKAGEDRKAGLGGISALKGKLELAKDIKQKGMAPTSEQYSALGFSPGTPIDDIIGSLTGSVTSAISATPYLSDVDKQSQIVGYYPDQEKTSKGSSRDDKGEKMIVNITVQGNVVSVDDFALQINESLTKLSRQGRTI